MNLRFVFCLLIISSFAVVQGKSQNKNFDRSIFYKILKSGKGEEIDVQINIVKSSSITEKEAYEGALLMKRSGMFAKAKDKLDMFRSGRSKLESSISKDNDNTEYRFLRLIIQEHAPKILRYRNELEKDSKWIRSNFNSLSPFLQQLIIDYSKESKILKISWLQFSAP